MSNTPALKPATVDASASNRYLNNPFVGLRAFEENDHHLFFGRDKPIDDLSKKLIQSRFLAVIGSSGSGKSSLVKSGLLPNIFSGFFTEGTNWRVALMRPGGDPIKYLTEALTEKKSLFPKVKKTGDTTYQAIIEANLRRSENGLVQVYKEAFGLLQVDSNAGSKKKTDNLLIVVDQFEELFRFRKIEKEKNLGVSDAQHFIKILLTAAQQSEFPIYVLITMRSDFLGDCSEFTGLPEAINEGQYLVPRMTRDEIRDCITRPVAVSTAGISPRLVTRLLNDINNDMDQLPVLQHTMMRTWEAWYNRMIDYWQTAALTAKYKHDEWQKWMSQKWESLLPGFNLNKEEVDKKKEKWDKKLVSVWEQYYANTDLTFQTWFKENQIENPVDLEDYTNIGTFKSALSNHADEAFTELKAEEEQRICELMFKALTDKTADARGTRRPRPVADLSKLCNTTEAQIIKVVEVFRKPGRTFLMPPADKGALTSESIIDISHESLMRLWERLVIWTDEEALNGDIFKRLAEDAIRYKKGIGSLWVNPELEIGLKWKEKFSNNEELIRVWAKSYNADVDEALAFLKKSNDAAITAKEKEERLIREKQELKEAEARRIKEEEEKERIRKRNRNRWALAILMCFFLVSVGFLILVYDQWKIAENEKKKAERSDSLAQLARDKAVLSDSLAQIDKRKAQISDSIAQINAVEAIRARDIAKAAEARAINEKNMADSLSRISAVGEYQRLIREGPEDKDSILRARYQYNVVAYCGHLDSLRVRYKISTAVKKNNELYEKLYFSCKALKAVDNAISLESMASAADYKENNYATKDYNGLIISATDNNCIVVNKDTIYMGKRVTAFSYSEQDRIIFFGLINGEIGFVKYQKNQNKYQPVFNRKNDLRSRITSLDFFTRNNRKYLLATGYAGAAVVFEFDSLRTISDQLSEDKKFPVVELPEYYGEIKDAKYDGDNKIKLFTSNKGTYIWNPFTDDLLSKLTAKLKKDELDITKAKTRLYQ